MPLLSLLWGAGGLTSLGKYLIIGVIGLGLAGWAVNGITAPYKDQIRLLNKQNQDLVLASKQKDAQIEADRKQYEEDRARLDTLEAEIEKVSHAESTKSDACRLSSEQLLWLKRIANQ